MYKRRIAIVDQKKCKPKLCGEVCVKYCPMNRMQKQVVYYENDQIKIEEGLCTGCGICSTKCPFGAIKIINLELILDDPLHQYGENRFRLFRFIDLPKNQTIGVIGQNGIGKSTIIKILAGQIIPNLGDYKNKSSYEKVIENFKGKEIQKTFINLNENKFNFAYKPQNIELIPQAFSGKVKELLQKSDKNQSLNEIVKLWQIENLLEKEISNLSGGELQKVAIVATILKNADVSFFDEPSSFLDIKQRFLFAQNIQTIKNTNIIIEHDLAILDYVSEFTHILFGQAHAYGICSHIKNTNVGINEFLQGFIKDENLKFRDYELNIEYTPSQIKTKDVLFEYPAKIIQKGDFKLEYPDDKILANQIIGILGENGTGKTTFIKGILDDASNYGNLKFGYKPQSLLLPKEDMEKLVMVYLKDCDKEILKDLWNKLNIERIKMYKLSELNGGDLQKVIVTKTLASDANVYLLDEPSAFLDVEERLNIAKAIRNVIFGKNKVAFVVDHDVLFLDFISDAMLIFEGAPGKNGKASNVLPKKEGMNKFLKSLNITYRKDPQTKRPRINKLDSSKDKEQKSSGNYYSY
jgi:ATP-binding cassette subfamily E protein 1